MLMPTFMTTLLLMSHIWFSRMWYSLPLVVVISLVYAATRHEELRPILQHATRFGIWVLGFMAVVFVILAVISALL